MEIGLFWAVKLNDIGMDLGHTFLLSIKTPLLAQLRVNTDSIIQSLPSADTGAGHWLPYDLTDDKTLLKEITDKITSLGVSDFSNEIFEEGIIDLTRATVDFCVILYDFTLYSLKVALPEISDHIQDCLHDFMRGHLSVLIESLGLQGDRNMKSFLLKSMRFLFATVIPCLENWIEEETGRVTLKLTDCRISIEKQHKDLVDDSHLVVPKKRSSIYVKRAGVYGDDEV